MSTDNQNRNRPRGGRGRNPQNNKNKKNNTNRPQKTTNQHQQFLKSNTPKPSFWQKILSFIGLGKKTEGVAGKQASLSQNQHSRQKQSPKVNVVDKRQGKPREPKPYTEKKTPASPREIDSSRLYIGNLSYDASEQDIEELFKGVGAVRSVEIIYNKHTHKSKGYGFVEMLRVEEARSAVEVLHDQHFMGRKMVVSGAKAKAFDEDSEESREKTTSAPRAEKIVEEVHSLEAPAEVA